MKNQVVKNSIAAFMLTAASLLLGGGSDQQSLDWLAKIKDVYAKGALSVDMDVNLSVEVQGAAMMMSMTGKQSYLDPEHLRGELKIKTRLPQGEIAMDVLMVLMGETVWMKINSPMMGGEQIMKMSLDAMTNMDSMNTLGLNQADMMDPPRLLANLAKMADLSFGGVKDGKVALHGKLTKEMMSLISATKNDSGAMDQGALTILLDEKNVFPLTVTMLVNEESSMNISFGNLKYLNAKELPEDYFNYTPPEGAVITDMDKAGQHQ